MNSWWLNFIHDNIFGAASPDGVSIIQNETRKPNDPNRQSPARIQELSVLILAGKPSLKEYLLCQYV
jgi:hypothetical protein